MFHNKKFIGAQALTYRYQTAAFERLFILIIKGEECQIYPKKDG